MKCIVSERRKIGGGRWRRRDRVGQFCRRRERKKRERKSEREDRKRRWSRGRKGSIATVLPSLRTRPAFLHRVRKSGLRPRWFERDERKTIEGADGRRGEEERLYGDRERQQSACMRAGARERKRSKD